MNKIEKSLLEYFNIRTRDKNGNFRDLYDIVKDAQKIYPKLNKNDKNLLKDLFLGRDASKYRFEEYMGQEQ